MAVNNIKLLRLINNTEVMGELHQLEKYKNLVLVKNPVTVIVVPSKSDPKSPSVGLAPYNQFSDDKEVIFDTQHILSIMNPISEFVNQYNSMFGGLVIPSKPSIIVP